MNNGLRKLGFWCAVCVIYLRYSLVHEWLTVHGGSNGKILYIFSIPALMCLIGSGGLQRFVSGRPARYWMAFVVWLFVCIPTSVWKGEAFYNAWDYLRTDLPLLLFLGSLPMTWKECRVVIYTIALAGITGVAFSRFYSADFGGRLGLNFGTLQNPNDYAGFLILTIPFMVFMVVWPFKIVAPLRLTLQLVCVAAIAYAFYLVMASGSRGAELALGACAAYCFFAGNNAARIGMLTAIPVGLLVIAMALPANVLVRLMSFSTDLSSNTGQALEAAESSTVRKELLMHSVLDTLTHPVFGVGAGEFGNYEGKERGRIGGGWSTSHNSYTEISADTGFPGILLYLAGTISAFLLLQRTRKLALRTPEGREMATACFLISVSMIGYCVAIFFLNFGYFFELPAFAGMIISLAGAVKRETDMLAVSAEERRIDAPSVFAGRRPAPIVRPGKRNPAFPPERARHQRVPLKHRRR